ncbi:MAG: alpha/beta fold hydrolase [Calditrichaceae bacterium]
MENLTEYCAVGVSFRDEMIDVSKNVSLRVITFTPPHKTSNPSVVFVAGWVSQISAWQEVLLEMTREFNVYYVETREKISSRVQGNVGYGVEEMGQDIVTLIEHFNLKDGEYLFFGSSLGATTILDSCRLLKTDPLCLVLVGPNAEFRVPKTWIFLVTIFYPPMYKLIKPTVLWYLKNFRLNVKHDRAQFEKYSTALDAADPWKLKKAVLSLAKYKIWDFLENVKFPALIIGASKDKLHEPENLKKIVRGLNNSNYLDMETNNNTHTKAVVSEMKKYLSELMKPKNEIN